MRLLWFWGTGIVTARFTRMQCVGNMVWCAQTVGFSRLSDIERKELKNLETRNNCNFTELEGSLYDQGQLFKIIFCLWNVYTKAMRFLQIATAYLAYSWWFWLLMKNIGSCEMHYFKFIRRTCLYDKMNSLPISGAYTVYLYLMHVIKPVQKIADFRCIWDWYKDK